MWINPGCEDCDVKCDSNCNITGEIADAFIDRILIYDPGHIEIRWKFSDEVMGFIGA